MMQESQSGAELKKILTAKAVALSPYDFEKMVLGIRRVWGGYGGQYEGTIEMLIAHVDEMWVASVDVKFQGMLDHETHLRKPISWVVN